MKNSIYNKRNTKLKLSAKRALGENEKINHKCIHCVSIEQKECTKNILELKSTFFSYVLQMFFIATE